MDKKTSTIKERVMLVAESLDMSKESFFRSIRATSANFRGKAKDSPLNSNTLVNIITKYPEVDLYWLVTGERKNQPYEVQSYVGEPEKGYEKACEACKEKDQMIAHLKNQLEEVKSDKEDLKKLLGLSDKS